MPILGVVASSFRVVADAGSMFPISSFVLPSSQATVEFTGIPSTYTHLQLRYIGRTTGGGNIDAYQAIRFNGDTTNGKYLFYHFMYATNTAAGSEQSGSQALAFAGRNVGPSAQAGAYSSGIIDILQYKNTNMNKLVRVFNGTNNNTEGRIELGSSLWIDTAAINSVQLLAGAGGYSFAAGSAFALYGIK